MRKISALIILGMLFLSGCSTMKTLVGLDEKPKPTVNGTPLVKASEVPSIAPTAAREYRHTTRQKLEEESQLQAGAGSMWVMEGQGSYLFAQNKTRREGDLLNVKMEGSAQREVETKVSVIKKLLKQLEDEEKRARDQQLGPTNTPAQADANGQPAATRAPASETAAADKPKEKEEKDEVKIESVPTRIVDRQPDGNYRIKGASPFMIGKKEYKVIVTGIIRPEDFNDDGVSSNKILDPQYDVVSLRRKE